MAEYSTGDIVGLLAKLGIENIPEAKDLVVAMHYLANFGYENVIRVSEPQFYREIRASVTAPIDPKALAAAEQMWRDQARRQAQTLAKNLTDVELQTFGKTISDGLRDGVGPREIARRMTMVQSLDPRRAEALIKYEQKLRAAGLSEENVAAAVEKERQRLLRERREVIAQTEARHATSGAALDTAKQRGARYKVWLSTGDGRVSDVCQANEAAGPIPIDEDFPSGVDRPPQHPNCRCSLSFITSDDQLERARARAEARKAKTEAAKES